MGIIEEAELSKLSSEKRSAEKEISNSMNSFARDLQNGLGEEMLSQLKTIETETENSGIKSAKKKNWFNNVLDRLFNTI